MRLSTVTTLTLLSAPSLVEVEHILKLYQLQWTYWIYRICLNLEPLARARSIFRTHNAQHDARSLSINAPRGGHTYNVIAIGFHLRLEAVISFSLEGVKLARLILSHAVFSHASLARGDHLDIFTAVNLVF